MAAGVYDISIEQGATFTLPIYYQDENGDPVPLSGAIARMQIREKWYQDDPDAEPYISLTMTPTLAGDGITINTTQALIEVTISDETTAGFTWRKGVYDLEIEYAGGSVDRLLKGKVTLDKEVTH